MATLFFFIAAFLGIIITTISLRYLNYRETLTGHRRALVLAIGLGLTWMISFLIPLLTPDVGVQISTSLIVFGITLSLFTFTLTYLIVRYLFIDRSK